MHKNPFNIAGSARCSIKPQSILLTKLLTHNILYYKLCPSSSRHISLLIWNRIYTVFALNREETVGVSVQFHIQVHRWCFVHKQPRVWEQKQKYRGMFETHKSRNKTSSGDIGLNIRTLASPKVGQDQVSGGVSVPCRHATPVANALWKPIFSNNVKVGKKSNYLGRMYPVELEIKDTTESNTSASYLDLLLSIGRDGQLHTSIYDKRDDFNFHITNFPFLSSNIPTSPAYGVFISQLMRYARACSSYGCFILRATRLSNTLLEQGYVKERLKSSLRKFYGRYGDLIKQYEVSLSQMLNCILWPDHIQWQPPTDQTLYRSRPFTEFWVVSIEHLRRVWYADRGRLLLRTPGPVPLGPAYVLLVETNPFPNLSLFYRTMLFEYPSVLSWVNFKLHGQSHYVKL